VAARDSVAAAPGPKALAQARRFVGVGEHPPGSNRTSFGHWFGVDGEPWCAIFLSYCFKVGAGIVLCGGVAGPGVNANGCAYVPTLERWLQDTDQWVDGAPAAGDIVVFDWDGGVPDHAGIVERSLGAGRLATIEGNCDNAVSRRERGLVSVAGFGRVRPYLVAAEPSYT